MSTISSSTSQNIALENLFKPDFYAPKNLDLVGFSDWQTFERSPNYSLFKERGFLPRLNRSQFADKSEIEQLNKTSAFIDVKPSSTNNFDLPELNNSQLVNQPLNFGLTLAQAATRFVELRQNLTPSGVAQTSALSEHPFNSNFGYGLVDAAGAVAAAISRTPFTEVPNLGGNNWGLDAVKAPEVWHQGYTGQETVVAVIDTGVDYTHSDLDSNIWINSKEIPGNNLDDDRNGFVDDIRGWDFVNDDSAPMDEEGHGTHVAGIIAAENNGFGTTGVAFNAKIMPVRVLGEAGGYQSDIAAGIRYAVDNGADAINLSLGANLSSAQAANAIKYAAEKGVVVVMAAGNESQSQPLYPARYAINYGIAVGAVNRNNQMPRFSNKAGTTQLDYVVAPGVNVYSTWMGNSYQFSSGTSMASPYVAGVAALILSANPNLSAAQVETILTSTANANATSVQAASSVNSTTGSRLRSSAAIVDSVTGTTIDADFDRSSVADAAVKDVDLDPVTGAIAQKGDLLREIASNTPLEGSPNLSPHLLPKEISPADLPYLAANFNHRIDLPLETGMASIQLHSWDNSTGYLMPKNLEQTSQILEPMFYRNVNVENPFMQ